jgi:CRP-like cAMP-binding protein
MKSREIEFSGETLITQKNHLLLGLAEDEVEAFQAGLELYDCQARYVFYEPGATIGYVYFPQNCVASILTVMQDGVAIEASTVGKEGLVGLPVFLGDDRSSQRAVCQVPGQVWRMEVTTFLELLGQSAALQKELGRYTQALIFMVAQSSACNRLHSIEERCARWLLLTHDRVDRDQFHLTQDYLASMLGVRRASVNEAAGALQKAGYIRYSRGVITVLDRPGLEAAACECYGVITGEFTRLLGPV